jgi:hypothetical protein
MSLQAVMARLNPPGACATCSAPSALAPMVLVPLHSTGTVVWSGLSPVLQVHCH